MSQFVRSDILAVLDAERRAMGLPSPSGDVVVERTEGDRSVGSCSPVVQRRRSMN